ncbi:apolipoprotein N-acyltransferase [Salinisphaera sp. T31B1]|uniref:apolipoprotein N-acyltransferase n=1 Tax=Salinisphaera sp. T31B1 TaxID=727963 RepID=UPI00333EDDBE
MRAVRVIGLDLLAPAVLGGLATLGFAPFGYYGLTLIAIVGLIALWWQAGARRAAWRGWVFGLAHFGTGIYWTFVSTYYYGGAPLPMAIGLVCLLSAYMAAYPMLVGAFAGFTRGLPRTLWALLLVPGAWLAAELMRSWVLTGFPWLSLGYSLIDAPLTALAPIGGVYFMGALMVAAAGMVVLLFAGSLIGRAVSVALLAAAPFALWLLPPASQWTRPAGEPVSVDVIQGNFPQQVKWDPDTFATTLTRYRNLTERSDADLVLWPEVAIPAPANRVQSYFDDIDAMAANRGQTVLAGTLVHQGDDQPYYNAVLALGAGHGRYYKRHLVPFGEYFPVPDFVMHWLDGINMRYSNFGFGAEDQPLIEVDGVKIGLSICFEDAFGYEIAKALPAAGILANVTNDAWFAGTTAADQHLEIARMRALEAGRPMLRAANTGISAVIDFDGRVRERTGQFEIANIQTRVQPRAGLTPYMRIGDWPLWTAGFLLTGVGLIAAIARRRRGRA